MNTLQLSLSALAGTVVLVGASTAAVHAADKLAEQEFSAEQSQKMIIECTYGGAYNDKNCKAEGKQKQSISGKQIVYAQTPQGKVAGVTKVHVPVDAALNSTSLAIIFATGLLGIAAFAGYLKLRA